MSVLPSECLIILIYSSSVSLTSISGKGMVPFSILLCFSFKVKLKKKKRLSTFYVLFTTALPLLAPLSFKYSITSLADQFLLIHLFSHQTQSQIPYSAKMFSDFPLVVCAWLSVLPWRSQILLNQSAMNSPLARSCRWVTQLKWCSCWLAAHLCCIN